MLKKNLALVNHSVHQACRQSGRNPDNVRMVAITKTHPVSVIMEAYEAGLRHFGENKVQELTSKTEDLPDDIVWHMVGHLQTNKIRNLVHCVDWIHSISKTKQLKELEKRLGQAERHVHVLFQVNISDEDQKSGCDAGDLPELLSFASGLQHVSVEGLMGMASFTDNQELIRKQFRFLRELRDKHRSFEGGNIRLNELSMGMSGDYSIAVEEGATLIRLGSTLFGSRDYT
ncbi:YggS family pyridoxal phosphate-dependent enzyme [Balneolaceae bacterium ANBcel3]|nr:YggS family pyridoxal phosphate-dependent enzyme [Balneolaceae bacterium ANBcel3]